MNCLGRLFNKLFSNFTEKNIIQSYPVHNYTLDIEDNEITPVLDILVRGNNKILPIDLNNIVGVYPILKY